LNEHGEVPSRADGGGARSPAAVVADTAAVFRSGRTRPLAWRIAQLDALEAMVVQETTAIEAALNADLGRGAMEGFLTEVYGVRREIRALRRGVRRWSATRRVAVPLPLMPARAWIRREPVGTVLVIGPWNYPINLILTPLAAAIAAGNCVVAKPSEHAPASSALLARLVPKYLDPEAIAVVEGDEATSRSLVAADVDHVFFTGSPATGRLVMAQAAERLTPVTLELGGKSPVVVAGDADIDVAARRIVWGKFMNAGQSCIAPDYVLVDATREAELLAALERTITAFYGTDPARSGDFGRIVNDAHLDRLANLLVGHGGEVFCGGSVDRAARYVAPTIVRHPSPTSALMSEEIFGPILPVLAVGGLEEAARFIGDRPPPLAVYLFTNDEPAAARVIDATRSGSVAINTTMHQFASDRLPFGGVGASGFGVYHGRFGFDALTQLRPVFAKARRPDLSFAYPPFGPLGSRLVRRVLSTGRSGRSAGRAGSSGVGDDR
jgi:aldehyde dehydrogenase (NAD+)